MCRVLQIPNLGNQLTMSGGNSLTMRTRRGHLWPRSCPSLTIPLKIEIHYHSLGRRTVAAMSPYRSGAITIANMGEFNLNTNAN